MTPERDSKKLIMKTLPLLDKINKILNTLFIIF